MLSRVDGPDARELFFNCQPDTGLPGPAEQAEAVYRAVLSALEAEGASFQSVVYETVFLQNVAADLVSVRAAREQVLTEAGQQTHQPAPRKSNNPH